MKEHFKQNWIGYIITIAIALTGAALTATALMAEVKQQTCNNTERLNKVEQTQKEQFNYIVETLSEIKETNATIVERINQKRDKWE